VLYETKQGFGDLCEDSQRIILGLILLLLFERRFFIEFCYLNCLLFILILEMPVGLSYQLICDSLEAFKLNFFP
jgi:hypothetical protein